MAKEIPAEETTEETPKETTEELYAGKYKTPDDLAKAYTELDSKLGEQGNQLGSLKAENAFLQSQLEKVQPTQEDPQAPDYDTELAEIQKKIDSGDLLPGEGLAKFGELSAKKSAAETAALLQQQQEQAMVDASRNNFLEQYDDFEAVKNSGALEEIKKTLPGFHDDVSAYYEYKLKETEVAKQAEIEAAKAEAFEAGKKAIAEIANGAKDTQKVLQTPDGGESAKEIGRETKTMTPLELQQSGLEALRKAREG